MPYIVRKLEMLTTWLSYLKAMDLGFMKLSVTLIRMPIEQYIVNLDEHLYVLHVFQKKSTSGIKTPKRDLNVIESRLKQLKIFLKNRSIS